MVRVYHVRAVPAPRQSGRDAYDPRPGVQRYHAFRDEVRLRRVQLPPFGYHVVFVMEMPKSWPKARRAAFEGKPHQQTPDKDNLEKALLDGVFNQADCSGDSHVWDGRVTKLWGKKPMIVISTKEPIDVHNPDLATWYEQHDGMLIDGQ